MAERLKAAVLKTVVPKGTRGSNPCSSARKISRPDVFRSFLFSSTVSGIRTREGAMVLWTIAKGAQSATYTDASKAQQL